MAKHAAEKEPSRFEWLWEPNSVGSARFAILSGIALVPIAFWIIALYTGAGEGIMYSEGGGEEGDMTDLVGGFALIYAVVRIVQGIITLRRIRRETATS